MLHQFATRHVRCVPRSSAQTSWLLLCAVCESRRTLVFITHAAGRGTAQHRHGEQSFHFSYCHILSYTCTEDVRADPMVMKENSRAEAAPTRATQVRDAKRRPAGAGRPCCAACIHQLVPESPFRSNWRRVCGKVFKMSVNGIFCRFKGQHKSGRNS